jgi:hypothetical protein
MVREFAVGSFPEGDEPKDLFRLIPLEEIGVGIAEGPSLGILRQKDENAGLPTAAGGDIVALDYGCFAVVRYRVKVVSLASGLENSNRNFNPDSGVDAPQGKSGTSPISAFCLK